MFMDVFRRLRNKHFFLTFSYSEKRSTNVHTYLYKFWNECSILTFSDMRKHSLNVFKRFSYIVWPCARLISSMAHYISAVCLEYTLYYYIRCCLMVLHPLYFVYFIRRMAIFVYMFYKLHIIPQQCSKLIDLIN